MENKLLQIKAQYPNYIRETQLETFLIDGLQLLDEIRRQFYLYKEDVSVEQMKAATTYCDDVRNDATYLCQKMLAIHESSTAHMIERMNKLRKEYEERNTAFLLNIEREILLDIENLNLENEKFYAQLADVEQLENSLKHLPKSDFISLKAEYFKGNVDDPFIIKNFLQADGNLAKKKLLTTIRTIFLMMKNSRFDCPICTFDECEHLYRWYFNELTIIKFLIYITYEVKAIMAGSNIHTVLSYTRKDYENYENSEYINAYHY